MEEAEEREGDEETEATEETAEGPERELACGESVEPAEWELVENHELVADHELAELAELVGRDEPDDGGGGGRDEKESIAETEDDERGAREDSCEEEKGTEDIAMDEREEGKMEDGGEDEDRRNALEDSCEEEKGMEETKGTEDIAMDEREEGKMEDGGEENHGAELPDDTPVGALLKPLLPALVLPFMAEDTGPSSPSLPLEESGKDSMEETAEERGGLEAGEKREEGDEALGNDPPVGALLELHAPSSPPPVLKLHMTGFLCPELLMLLFRHTRAFSSMDA